MIFVFIIAGAVLGALLFEGEGIILGLLGGYLFYRTQESKGEIEELNAKVDSLEHVIRLAASKKRTASSLSKDTTLDTPPVAEPEKAPEDQPAQEEEASERSNAVEEPVAKKAPETEAKEEVSSAQVDSTFDDPDQRKADREPKSTAARQDRPARSRYFPQEQDIIDKWINKAKAFILGGNIFGRLGIAVLFIGLSFLVKEAIEVGFFPIELRLAAAFLIGSVLIYLGWRLKEKRPVYGLTLQGGGLAILYLTIFASFRLYNLVDAEAALMFLVVITVLGAIISVMQNAQSLAVISLLGGFLAPVITSTGSGNHIALFSYYAVLNAGIFYMAWHKPWRALHITGFISTFAVATFWGGLSYEPSLFNTTEPFLILFFLIYFAVAIMYAMRHGLEPKKIVDGTLVFGLPVVAFTLQAALVEPFEFGLAWSALAMGGCYAIAAWFIHKRDAKLWRTLVEAFAGISLALLSMTIPFALDATWTGAGWALEGAALIWLGVRQRRFLVRLSGMALTLFASISFMYGLQDTSFQTFQAYRFILNPAFMGFISLSLSALFAAYQIHKHPDKVYNFERLIGSLLLFAGLMWWMSGGLEELRREFTVTVRLNLQLVFLSLSFMVAALLGKRSDWSSLIRTSLLLIPGMYISFMLYAFQFSHPFASWGFVPWVIAMACLYSILYLAEEVSGKRTLAFAHATALWLGTLLLFNELVWFSDQQFDLQTGWSAISYFIAPLLSVGLVSWASSKQKWPMLTHNNTYLKLAAIPLLIGVWMGSMHLSFENAGSAAPLPFIPLLNPIDIMLGFGLLVSVYWYRSTQKVDPDFFSDEGRLLLKWVLVISGFIWMNATIGRAVHHWGGIPYDDVLLDSSAFQSAISICWTLLAVSVMAYAARKEYRTPWIVSACLLAVVVIKLFVIDLSNLTTIHRVISFIGVGVLLLIIKYMAPVPPKKEEQLSEQPDS